MAHIPQNWIEYLNAAGVRDFERDKIRDFLYGIL